MIEIGDSVRVIGGGSELWTVVGTRSAEPCYSVQLGKDGASVQWRRTIELELAFKAEGPVSQPGFVPDKGIMDW